MKKQLLTRPRAKKLGSVHECFIANEEVLIRKLSVNLQHLVELKIPPGNDVIRTTTVVAQINLAFASHSASTIKAKTPLQKR
jgi:hypothetical protein